MLRRRCAVLGAQSRTSRRQLTLEGGGGSPRCLASGGKYRGNARAYTWLMLAGFWGIHERRVRICQIGQIGQICQHWMIGSACWLSLA